MARSKYLIIGGGMAADAAVQGIREIDSSGEIVLVSAEAYPPYNRPPLSKGLWKGEALESIERSTTREGVRLVLKRIITTLDLAAMRATDDRGATYECERVLLATGGTPRRLPFGDDAVIWYRTRGDYRRLRDLCGEGRVFAVIGGGFIGSEIAAALAMNGQRVHLIFPQPGLCARVFPAALSRWLADFYAQKGVQVHAGATVRSLERSGERHVLRLSDGTSVEADGIVGGIGLEPAVELARSAGLEVVDGIVVDELLRAGHPEVFAAGDVARFPSPQLGRQVRFEHEDAALTMGRAAGRNMAGANEPYRHLPMFYSDLFDLGYEAVGDIDPSLQTFEDWKQPNREGVIYYLRDKQVHGVLLVNTWNQVDNARALISDGRPVRPEELKGRLPR